MADNNKIRIQCPNCHAVGSGSAAHLERRLVCPKCRETVQMQPAEQPAEKPEQRHAEKPEQDTAEHKAPGARREASPNKSKAANAKPKTRTIARDKPKAETTDKQSDEQPRWAVPRLIVSAILALFGASLLVTLGEGVQSDNPDLLPLPIRVIILGGLAAAFIYASYLLWPRGIRLSMPNLGRKSLYCMQCGTTAPPNLKARGNLALEMLIWLLALSFALPTLGITLFLALVYSLGRHFSRTRICSACGAESVVPADSPNAVSQRDKATQ